MMTLTITGKKKQTTPGTKKGRGRPKKKEENKWVTIQGPENDIRKFVSIDHAVNHIYNYYPTVNHRFSKNMMRHNLAKHKAIAYDVHKQDFDYEFMDKPGGLEYAILRCDLWEVIKNESK
jgi:hypothetical protein